MEDKINFLLVCSLKYMIITHVITCLFKMYTNNNRNIDELNGAMEVYLPQDSIFLIWVF